jgi:glutamate dehydrogenase/leucine dehydrogenase
VEEAFRFADDLGPEKMVHLYDPRTQLRAVVAIDNVACGPAIGGVRMAVDVSADEAFRLARAMTLKSSAAGLRHGGGKSVIFGDPRMPADAKEALVRAFARGIRDLVDYIPGPDMGTDERCMAWIRDEIGRATGLPSELGGIPLDEIGATGFGLAVCVEHARTFCDLRIEGARLVVQGFGSVGRHAARFLAEKGAVLVAVADSAGAVHDPAGLDLAGLLELKAAGRPVADYPSGIKIARDDVVAIECDILIPAARPDVVREDNAGRVKTRLIVQGANIPATEAAEEELHRRGVLSVPDFIANAGGLICAAVEYAGGGERQAFATIEEKIGRNTALVLEQARKAGTSPRRAALALARRRVQAAMEFRRHR